MKYILDDEKAYRYASTRLLGKEMSHQDINTLALYNAYMSKLLRGEMARQNISFSRIIQENEREAIYHDEENSKLLIAQPSSKERAVRYERMFERFSDVINKNFERKTPINYEIHQRCSQETGCESEAVTNIEYDNMRHDFVVRMFLREPRYISGRIFPTMDVKDINTVIFGPLNALKRHSKVIEEGRSDYLKSQIIEIEGKNALNIDYVYGSQGGGLIKKLSREFNEIAKQKSKKSKKSPLYIYYFGRAASLDDKFRQNDIAFTTSITDWVSIERGYETVFNMENTFSRRGHKLLNVPSVIDQTYEQLELAKKLGCTFIEMEQREMMEAVFFANRNYDKLDIHFGSVVHVSDLPLHKITLADEFDCSLGEDRALEVIKENIIKQK
jgi:hypothetical protein